jgi:hypothetical protein
MTMSGRKLNLRTELVESGNAQNGAHQTLARCADVPDGMYGHVW